MIVEMFFIFRRIAVDLHQMTLVYDIIGTWLVATSVNAKRDSSHRMK